MDVSEAVKTAKNYVVDVLHDEGIRHVASGEVLFDEKESSWRVTISFFRPANQLEGLAATLSVLVSWKDRSFKVVEINQTGTVISDDSAYFSQLESR